jgi:triosephosphate isomerase
MPGARQSRPVIIVNCKTYAEATGRNVVRLAKLCEQMAKKYRCDIRIAVQPTDLALVAKAVRIPVYAQHVDEALPGKTTGWLTAHAIKQAGAAGTILNHSEHRLSTEQISATIAQLKRAKLDVVVCAESVERLQELDRALGSAAPSFFAVEPPELIGGDISVSTAQPEIITRSVRATKLPVLVGAGVKDNNDLAIALKLGARGVLLASGIVLAKNQKKALTILLEA